MKEGPILFSTPMVLATLADRKTHTRRTRGLERFNDRGRFIHMERDRRGVWCAVFGDSIPDDPCPVYVPSPYGGPGDRLWVKESIRRLYEPVGEERWCDSEFIADGQRTKADAWPWKNKALPSIHMPRGLSRITLDVRGVRVERLLEITEADAKAEGVEKHETLGCAGWWRDYMNPSHACVTAVDSFRSLWGSINGAESWKANPFVWVVEFRRLTDEEARRV